MAIELKSVNYENLFFDELKYDFVRSDRLYYNAIFTDKTSNKKYKLLIGVLYTNEQSKGLIRVFSLLISQ